MEVIADFVIKIVDLFDAEFTEIREKAFKVLIAIGLLLSAALLAMAGFAMIVYGIFLAFSIFMPPFLAAFVDALLAFILGGGLVLCAKRKMA
ncbi:hypothetical protein [Desulfitobacterium sp.]|uniref:hypothetical protein n=1 Tax=Desulfitobacterium sp. TaxID=49981 RepID=UPI002B695B84|nr:hypothetical protein [Desulfitobacterium sp.]HVJ48972.1 hypothetical protein [Desulfitobacterium sp.]